MKKLIVEEKQVIAMLTEIRRSDPGSFSPIFDSFLAGDFFFPTFTTLQSAMVFALWKMSNEMIQCFFLLICFGLM